MSDDTGVSYYSSDECGNITEYTDGAGNTVRYEYDAAGRVTDIRYPDKSTVSYTYDRNDRILTVTYNGRETTGYTYDALGREILRELPNGNVTETLYDADGRKIRLTTVNGSGKKTSEYRYAYDERGYIEKEEAEELITDAAGGEKSAGTSGGSILLLPFGLGTVPKEVYGQAEKDAVLIKETTYQYDEDGRLTYALTEIKGKGIRIKGITGRITEYVYGYDEAGNRIREEVRENGELKEKRETEYNELNQPIRTEEYTKEGGNRNCTYSYDADGNLTEERETNGTETGRVTCSYEAEDRLKAVYDREGLIAAYVYDGDGNRVGKIEHDPVLYGNLTEESELNRTERRLRDYITDEEESLYELTGYVNDINREYTEVLMERRTAGALTGYIYGNERIGITGGKAAELSGVKKAAGYSAYYQYDGRGSVVSITGKGGERTAAYSYDPKGRAEYAYVKGGSRESFYGYNGESQDPKTGAIYLRARYYNTERGTFNTEDTYLGNLMKAGSLNRYAYAAGNPVNRKDPGGHMSKTLMDGAEAFSTVSGCMENVRGNQRYIDEPTYISSCNVAEDRGIVKLYRTAEAYLSGISARKQNVADNFNRLFYETIADIGKTEPGVFTDYRTREESSRAVTEKMCSIDPRYQDNFRRGYDDGCMVIIIEAAATILIAIAVSDVGFGYRESGPGAGYELPGESTALKGSSPSTKPLQEHHFATNKSKKYTSQFENIANKYGLDLDEPWNKDFLLHQGRHPYDYHEFVLGEMSEIDNIANGNKEVFLDLFEENVKSVIRENPDMLYKNYWLNK